MCDSPGSGVDPKRTLTINSPSRLPAILRSPGRASSQVRRSAVGGAERSADSPPSGSGWLQPPEGYQLHTGNQSGNLQKPGNLPGNFQKLEEGMHTAPQNGPPSASGSLQTSPPSYSIHMMSPDSNHDHNTTNTAVTGSKRHSGSGTRSRPSGEKKHPESGSKNASRHELNKSSSNLSNSFSSFTNASMTNGAFSNGGYSASPASFTNASVTNGMSLTGGSGGIPGLIHGTATSMHTQNKRSFGNSSVVNHSSGVNHSLGTSHSSPAAIAPVMNPLLYRGARKSSGLGSQMASNAMNAHIQYAGQQYGNQSGHHQIPDLSGMVGTSLPNVAGVRNLFHSQRSSENGSDRGTTIGNCAKKEKSSVDMKTKGSYNRTSTGIGGLNTNNANHRVVNLLRTCSTSSWDTSNNSISGNSPNRLHFTYGNSHPNFHMSMDHIRGHAASTYAAGQEAGYMINNTGQSAAIPSMAGSVAGSVGMASLAASIASSAATKKREQRAAQKALVELSSQFTRQEYSNLEFHYITKNRVDLLDRLGDQESDTIFGFLILLNLLFIGIETDLYPSNGGRSKEIAKQAREVGEQQSHFGGATVTDPPRPLTVQEMREDILNPFFFLEIIFFVIFSCELVVRWKAVKKKEQEEEYQEKLRQRAEDKAQRDALKSSPIDCYGSRMSNHEYSAILEIRSNRSNGGRTPSKLSNGGRTPSKLSNGGRTPSKTSKGGRTPSKTSNGERTNKSRTPNKTTPSDRSGTRTERSECWQAPPPGVVPDQGIFAHSSSPVHAFDKMDNAYEKTDNAFEKMDNAFDKVDPPCPREPSMTTVNDDRHRFARTMEGQHKAEVSNFDGPDIWTTNHGCHPIVDLDDETRTPIKERNHLENGHHNAPQTPLKEGEHNAPVLSNFKSLGDCSCESNRIAPMGNDAQADSPNTPVQIPKVTRKGSESYLRKGSDSSLRLSKEMDKDGKVSKTKDDGKKDDEKASTEVDANVKAIDTPADTTPASDSRADGHHTVIRNASPPLENTTNPLKQSQQYSESKQYSHMFNTPNCPPSNVNQNSNNPPSSSKVCFSDEVSIRPRLCHSFSSASFSSHSSPMMNAWYKQQYSGTLSAGITSNYKFNKMSSRAVDFGPLDPGGGPYNSTCGYQMQQQQYFLHRETSIYRGYQKLKDWIATYGWFLIDAVIILTSGLELVFTIVVLLMMSDESTNDSTSVGISGNAGGISNHGDQDSVAHPDSVASVAPAMPVSVLRVVKMLTILRVCRTVKLLRYSKPLFLVCHGLLAVCKTIVWIVALLFGVIYISAVILVKFFGHDQHYVNLHADLDDKFGTVASGVWSLFKVFTLERWPVIAESITIPVGEWMRIFFIVFICASNFTVFSLVIAIVLQHIRAINVASEIDLMNLIVSQRDRMKTQLVQLFHLLDVDKSGEISTEEFKDALENNTANVNGLLEEHDLHGENVAWLFTVLDKDGSGSVSLLEFVEGIEGIKSSETSRMILSCQANVLRALHQGFQARMEKLEMLSKKVKEVGRGVRNRSKAKTVRRKVIEDEKQTKEQTKMVDKKHNPENVSSLGAKEFGKPSSGCKNKEEKDLIKDSRNISKTSTAIDSEDPQRGELFGIFVSSSTNNTDLVSSNDEDVNASHSASFTEAARTQQEERQKNQYYSRSGSHSFSSSSEKQRFSSKDATDDPCSSSSKNLSNLETKAPGKNDAADVMHESCFPDIGENLPQLDTNINSPQLDATADIIRDNEGNDKKDRTNQSDDHIVSLNGFGLDMITPANTLHGHDNSGNMHNAAIIEKMHTIITETNETNNLVKENSQLASRSASATGDSTINRSSWGLKGSNGNPDNPSSTIANSNSNDNTNNANDANRNVNNVNRNTKDDDDAVSEIAPISEVNSKASTTSIMEIGGTDPGRFDSPNALEADLQCGKLIQDGIYRVGVNSKTPDSKVDLRSNVGSNVLTMENVRKEDVLMMENVRKEDVLTMENVRKEDVLTMENVRKDEVRKEKLGFTDFDHAITHFVKTCLTSKLQALKEENPQRFALIMKVF